MKVLYGTTNISKLEYMKKILHGPNIEVVGLNDVKGEAGPIDETGTSPIENARQKALAYYKTFNMPVFSCDSGLYIEGLDASRQPGVHVRRVNGKTLNDEEMIEYYSGIAKEFGGMVKAKYKNAICLVKDSEQIFEYDGDDIAGEKFIITSLPHKKRNIGFPLDSLSIQIESGKYYMDIHTTGKRAENIYNAYRNFFTKALKL